jgi:Raf kinase inhibitor-like YbhB/YbcL family protein
MNMSTPNFSLTSPVFEQGTAIPTRYTCDGDNINPPLRIAGTPPTARALALIVDDPDAPSGIWSHWLLWNMDPAKTEILERSVPSGCTQGTNNFDRLAYGGPCPPSGRHRYFFRLYALDERLDLGPEADRSMLLKAMQGHILVQTELMGTYVRAKHRR